MKNLLLSILLLFGISNNMYSQNIKYTKTIGSTSHDEAWDVAVDANNNMYTYGYFQGTVKFGSISKTAKGGRDHFLVKYDCSGNVLWVQTIGSTSDEYAYQMRMSLDKRGNIYLTSAYAGTCTFSSANNSSKSATANSGYDIYIAKYDISGNIKWLNTYGGSAEDVGYDIQNDDSSNVYITGKFSTQVSFGSTSFTSYGGFDVFALKLDSAGSIQWVQQGHGSAGDEGIGINVDSRHNVFVCGSAGTSNGTITFGSVTSLSSAYNTGFFAKLDINGDCQWMESVYSTWGDTWCTMAIDGNDNIYITGTCGTKVVCTSEDGNNYSGGAIPAQNNVCIAKYDNNGNLKWFNTEGPSSSGQKATGYGICVSSDNNTIYESGYVGGSLTLGSFSNSYQGNADLFIAVLDTSGNYTSAIFGGSTGDDMGLAVCVDKSDNLYVCGMYEDACSVNGGSLKSAGMRDGYVFKYCNSSAAIDSTVTTTGSTTLCGNDSVLFSVTYDPNYSYSWKKNGSTISGANSYYYYASQTGSYSVLIGSSSCCSQSQSQSIQVQNLTFSKILGNDTTVCGAIYQLSANSPQGSKFLWNTGDTSRAITLNNSGVYSIISAYNGCVAYDTIQVTLKNVVVSLGNDTVVCNGSIILDAQNTGKTYKWNDGSTNQTLTVTKTGSYSVNVIDAQCTASDNIFVTIDIVSLNLGKDVKTCQNNSYTFDAGTASSYSWSTGENTRKIVVNTSGDYWCKITDVLGCTARDTVAVYYYPAASANFRDSLVSSHLIKFIPDSTQYTSYFWTFDGTNNSSSMSPTQYFPQTGTATVFLKVTTKDGCIDSVTKTVYTTEIANKFESKYNINIFPNPNNGLFTIDMNLHKKSDVLIQSFDLTGRKVYENKLNGVPTGEQLIPVYMQNLTQSIYLIKITIDGVNVVHRLVNIN